MVCVRKIEIENFRGIKSLSWCPSNGINCLIGRGDSGKSSVLDAIDFCLGARNPRLSDTDFHKLEVDKPVKIVLTIGNLDDTLKDIGSFGRWLRGFNPKTGEVKDEPEKDLETVLTIELTAKGDLEVQRRLVSDRAAAQGRTRSFSQREWIRMAPVRIDGVSKHHLGWGRGSTLHKLTPEGADIVPALIEATRAARKDFGEKAHDHLGGALAQVERIAKDLGIPLAAGVRAMLDAQRASFGEGAVSLHDGEGVPAKSLGEGSMRLLIAGLQGKAAERAGVILVDEIEHGLEPHRIMRFIGLLGAKDQIPVLQVFATTHSPVALRELSGDQLFVLRRKGGRHEVVPVGAGDGAQGAIRAFPDAFLAPSVLICEGASEVGLIRGLDQFRVGGGRQSISARGVAVVDAGGIDNIYKRNDAFASLGYRTAILRDDDVPPDRGRGNAFIKGGGTVITWGEGRALEDELFYSLSEDGVSNLIDRAIELHGKELVDGHIKSASNGEMNLNNIQSTLLRSALGEDANVGEARRILGAAAKSGWFKSVTKMEGVAREIVGPDMKKADPGFHERVEAVFKWAEDVAEWD